jgi:regulatory protein
MINKSKKPIKKLSVEEALIKAASFCAYQERCKIEVIEKLKSFELSSTEIDKVIDSLIDQNFLNEARFATAFAGGKFRVKKWGKIKISYELRQRRISDSLIRNALAEINEEDYKAALQHILSQKQATLSPDDPQYKQKIVNYALSKGYESDLIFQMLKE